MSWLGSLGTQDTADFYYGSDTASANSTEWTDKRSLQGASGLVIYDGPTGSDPVESVIKISATSGLTFSGTFTISTIS